MAFILFRQICHFRLADRLGFLEKRFFLVYPSDRRFLKNVAPFFKLVSRSFFILKKVKKLKTKGS